MVVEPDVIWPVAEFVPAVCQSVQLMGAAVAGPASASPIVAAEITGVSRIRRQSLAHI
ncbi:hypothetical protein KO353_01340 [Elioraea tepida]|uniref:Uncharacterized protein n=1 Tax=Elioraea tepida TaxID=2843330 RepID=A0A975U3K5_9PROT|nr:hypothetical protein [Elioraea tepida]QXM24934.1 hypothetical protein KO353_01340 [Elioraea tepida]